MVKEQAGIQVVRQVENEIQSSFRHYALYFLLCKFLILSLPARFALAHFHENIALLDFQHFSQDLFTCLQPRFMLFVFHAMPALVFCSMYCSVKQLYSKGELRQI